MSLKVGKSLIFRRPEAINQVSHAIQDFKRILYCKIEDLAYVFAVSKNQIVENKRVWLV